MLVRGGADAGGDLLGHGGPAACQAEQRRDVVARGGRGIVFGAHDGDSGFPGGDGKATAP